MTDEEYELRDKDVRIAVQLFGFRYVLPPGFQSEAYYIDVPADGSFGKPTATVGCGFLTRRQAMKFYQQEDYDQVVPHFTTDDKAALLILGKLAALNITHNLGFDADCGHPGRTGHSFSIDGTIHPDAMYRATLREAIVAATIHYLETREPK